jgi:vacuolar-type H+-ATPase subunit H
MASIRDLKQDINYVLGDIIDAATIHQAANSEESTEKSEQIIDDAINTFDVLIAKVNDKKVDNRSSQLKGVRKELEKEGDALIERLNSL